MYSFRYGGKAGARFSLTTSDEHVVVRTNSRNAMWTSLQPLRAPAEQAYDWLQCVDPSTLNVAGPRASQDPAIYRTVVELLRTALAQLAG